MVHDFEKSLQHERSQTGKADCFYRNVFHATEIVRYNSDSEFDMVFQRKDIDVSIRVENKFFHISEKFRETDYGDLYVEVYSKYPHVKGWLHTGSPDVIVYFTPISVYRIKHQSLQVFCLEKLFPAIPEKWFREIYCSGKAFVRKNLILDKKQLSINLIQAHNKPADSSSWETIGIAIPFETLERNGVKIKKYPPKALTEE